MSRSYQAPAHFPQAPWDKRWKFKDYSSKAAQTLAQDLEVPLLFAQILLQRGIDGRDQARLFFRPCYADLPSPWTNPKMKTLVEALAELKVKPKFSLIVYKDTSLDAFFAASMLEDLFESLGIGFKFCSSKFKLEQLLLEEHSGPIWNLSQAEVLLEGLDWEDLASTWPEGLAMPLSLTVFQLYAACVEYFSLSLEAWYRQWDLLALSFLTEDFVLQDHNRSFLILALEQIHQGRLRKGLALVLERLIVGGSYEVEVLARQLVPRLRALLCLGQAKVLKDLLHSEEAEVLAEALILLEQTHQLRRHEQSRAQAQAQAQWEGHFRPAEQVLCWVEGEDWHEGILSGLALGLERISQRPVLVFTQQGLQTWVGTYRALSCSSELLAKHGIRSEGWGNHLRLYASEAQAFRALARDLEDELAQDSRDYLGAKTQLALDVECHFSDLTPRFWQYYQLLRPFGLGNPPPIFLSKLVRDTGYSRSFGPEEAHVNLVLRQDGAVLRGRAFHAAQYLPALASRRLFHLCYRLVAEEDSAQGFGFILEDWRF